MNTRPLYIIAKFYSVPKTLLFGAGLAHAVENSNWHHIPAALIFPGAYAGYQLWENRATLVRHYHEQV